MTKTVEELSDAMRTFARELEQALGHAKNAVERDSAAGFVDALEEAQSAVEALISRLK